MNCLNCGAPMRLLDGRNCLTCDYCGSEYLPEKNEDGVRALDDASEFSCPVCAVPLVHAVLEAHQILYEAGHARQDHRRVVDQVAATLILQSFMEQRSENRDQRSEI